MNHSDHFMFADQKREIRGQNHSTPATRIAFWKGIIVAEHIHLFLSIIQFFFFLFGKIYQTDTASVLHEAIEYIKFLHDQVSVSRSMLYIHN